MEQPPVVEFVEADGIFIKQMYLHEVGTLVPQHSHKYEHVSMLACGAVRVWVDGDLVGDFEAPRPIIIQANRKHLFQSLLPDTIIYCIHNIERTGAVEIAEEHQLEV